MGKKYSVCVPLSVVKGMDNNPLLTKKGKSLDLGKIDIKDLFLLQEAVTVMLVENQWENIKPKFEEMDVDSEKKITRESFKKWMKENPVIPENQWDIFFDNLDTSKTGYLTLGEFDCQLAEFRSRDEINKKGSRRGKQSMMWRENSVDDFLPARLATPTATPRSGRRGRRSRSNSFIEDDATKEQNKVSLAVSSLDLSAVSEKRFRFEPNPNKFKSRLAERRKKQLSATPRIEAAPIPDISVSKAPRQGKLHVPGIMITPPQIKRPTPNKKFSAKMLPLPKKQQPLPKLPKKQQPLPKKEPVSAKKEQLSGSKKKVTAHKKILRPRGSGKTKKAEVEAIQEKQIYSFSTSSTISSATSATTTTKLAISTVSNVKTDATKKKGYNIKYTFHKIEDSKKRYDRLVEKRKNKFKPYEADIVEETEIMENQEILKEEI